MLPLTRSRLWLSPYALCGSGKGRTCVRSMYPLHCIDSVEKISVPIMRGIKECSPLSKSFFKPLLSAQRSADLFRRVLNTSRPGLYSSDGTRI